MSGVREPGCGPDSAATPAHLAAAQRAASLTECTFDQRLAGAPAPGLTEDSQPLTSPASRTLPPALVAAAQAEGRTASYDATQHRLNCTDRRHADPAGLAARMADLLEMDAVRLRRWLFARCVLESPGNPALLDVARRLPLH